MVGGPERTPSPQPATLKLFRDAGDHRDFEGFGRLERWQDAGKARGKLDLHLNGAGLQPRWATVATVATMTSRLQNRPVSINAIGPLTRRGGC